MVVSFCCLVGSLLTFGESASVVPANGFPGPAPGTAIARIDDECLVLENAVMAATWELGADRFGLMELTNRMSGTTIRAQQQQRLQMHDPDDPIDDPLMTQQRVRQHAADGIGGHGPGMLGRGEGNNDSCPRDCPND